ncbi:hypothetical protein TSUD_345940 [Trifolium subterraneum]|nr:hypothetical protein TSUD_345940 [Trifolium subterraneum]
MIRDKEVMTHDNSQQKTHESRLFTEGVIGLRAHTSGKGYDSIAGTIVYNDMTHFAAVSRRQQVSLC